MRRVLFLWKTMAVTILKWIGSNGEILTPLTTEEYNEGNMISTKGTFFFAVTTSSGAEGPGGIGSPMGLLLALTYAE